MQVSRVAQFTVEQHELSAGRSPSEQESRPESPPPSPMPLSVAGVPRRGRPPTMSSPELLDRIRRLADSRDGLFRVHRRNSGLYARARRCFGSWSAAVAAAGLDYLQALNGARLRSLKTRRRRLRGPDRIGISP